LHCKDVKPLNQEKLLSLAAYDPSIRASLMKALAWITDERLYEAATSEDLERCSLTRADVELQIARGKIEFTNSWRGTCKSGRVPEHAKRRFRAIQHPKVANHVTAKPEPVNFASTAERHSAILRGQFVLSLDFAAFFDQFLMKEEVRDFFAFHALGKVARMKVMPMGLKHSVGVAQESTKQLLNFKSSVYSEAYVDNVRFVHDDVEDLLSAASTFLVRCAWAEVTVNEVDVSVLRGLEEAQALELAKSLLRPLVKSKEAWLGEVYDYEKKEISIADRTREKIERCFDQKTPTYRHLAARFGLLLYAARTLGMKLSAYFAARRAMQVIGRLMARREDWWDRVAPPLCESVVSSMRAWRDDILRAAPRHVTAPCEPQLVIITDASNYGWGAIAMDDEGRESSSGQEWTTADHATNFTTHSARAEPEAVFRAACRWVRRRLHRLVHVISDSSTAVGALGKGHSASFHVNGVCARLNETFPGVRFVFSHVAGEKNPADAISRGATEPTAQEWDRARELADAALEQTS
jgi:hypothetical protein